MNLRTAIACALVSLAALAAGPKLTEDPPLVRAPKDGNICGVIRPASQVARLFVVSRATKAPARTRAR